MATAYAPGLMVTARTRHRTRRLLPIAGDVLVQVGQQVEAHHVVAQTLMPGDIVPLNMARLLAVAPGEVPGCMLVAEGAAVVPGDLLARTKGIFGMFRTEYPAQVTGTIESISAITGQVIARGQPIPLQVKAYLTGRVVEIVPGEGCVIEADVTFVQGIFGIGGETSGPIMMACDRPGGDLTEARITEAMRGAVVVGGARITAGAIAKARQVGVSALVSGGIDDQDLTTLLGYDLGVAVTGSEHVGLTIVITEGFGDIAMADRTFRLLARRAGQAAAVNGTTQIRAGVMRPEIVVPLSAAQQATESEPQHSAGVLEIGRPVRVIRDPYFGALGTVSGLEPELQRLDSGSLARTLDVHLASGATVRVPRANVELIEE